MQRPSFSPILLGALACMLLAGAGLLWSEPALLGYDGAEVYGHAWVQWWHGEALPQWPAGTDLAVGADPWPVIDPLPTFLGAALGRLVGYTASWNLLALLGVGGAFVGGAVLAKRYDGDPLVGGVVGALGPALAGSLASGLTEDWALGLLAGALALLAAPSAGLVLLGGALLGLVAWCGLYLALLGALMALLLGLWRVRRDPSALKIQAGAAALALLIAIPAAALQGPRLQGQGHRQGEFIAQQEPLWRLNPWKGADLASFVTPGPADLSGHPLVRMHPAYLGLLVLGLALWGGRSRWWVVLGVSVVASTGEHLSFAGQPLGLRNPLVVGLQQLPITGLLNHHGRLLLAAQLALAVLAARGAMRLPAKWRPLAAIALALELSLASPALWPLPLTQARIDPVLVELGQGPAPAGRLLVVPLGGPGVHFQKPLFEQRAHGIPLSVMPNRPGAPSKVTATPIGRWLAGPPLDPPPGLDPGALGSLGIGAVYVRSERVEWAARVFGEPALQSEGGALYRIE